MECRPDTDFQHLATVSTHQSATMTKMILAALALVSFVAAAPQNKEPVAIVSQASDLGLDGTYSYSYESADGTKAQQSGQLKSIAPNEEGEAITGSFAFVAPDGVSYSVTYTADENGFQPQADHLPVAPPVPEAIQRSIEYNLAHPEEDKSQK